MPGIRQLLTELNAEVRPRKPAIDPAFTAVHVRSLVTSRRDVPMADQIDELERTVEPTWSGLVEPLELLTDRLGVAWGTVSHLKAVRDSKELREAVEVASLTGSQHLRMTHRTLLRPDCACSHHGSLLAADVEGGPSLLTSVLKYVFGSIQKCGSKRSAPFTPENI